MLSIFKSILAAGCRHIYTNKLRVLFYHRVNNYAAPLGIDTYTFEKQIQYLSRKYNIISLSKYIRIIENNDTIQNGLLITFDDGYRDNYFNAYPVLKRYSIPATIFLTTAFIDGSSWIWHDIFRYVIDSTPVKRMEIELGDSLQLWDLESSEGRLKARRNIYEYCKNYSRPERLQRLGDLAKILKVEIPMLPTEKYSPLTWDDIKEMSQNKIEFGAHTINHEILSKIGDEEAHFEVSESKKRIEEQLQSEVCAFAYPNGKSEDFTEDTKLLLQRCGYKVAFTTINGVNDMATDKLLNNRISGGNIFDNNFVANVSGLPIITGRIKNFHMSYRQY